MEHLKIEKNEVEVKGKDGKKEIIGEQFYLQGEELSLEQKDNQAMNEVASVQKINEKIEALTKKIRDPRTSDDDRRVFQAEVETLETELAEKESVSKAA
jgi:RNA polymerase-interacting CarD/CdnL/TRCF family regulator